MIPLDDLRGNMETLLTGDCLEYTTKLLAEAAKLFAGNYPHLKTIMEGYNKITAPGQGGYVFKTEGYDTVSGNLFANGAISRWRGQHIRWLGRKWSRYRPTLPDWQEQQSLVAGLMMS